MTIRAADSLPILDLRGLTDAQLVTAKRIFDEFRALDLKPAYLADANRAARQAGGVRPARVRSTTSRRRGCWCDLVLKRTQSRLKYELFDKFMDDLVAGYRG